MNVLALDTFDRVLSVALETPGGLWYMEMDSADARHSELLLEFTDRLHKMAGIRPEELNLVACTKGPGSFTGLRIGFSAAKGIALALGIPLISVPSLDCLAHTLSAWPGIVLPAIDAKKASFFASLYRGGLRITDYMDISPAELAEVLKNARTSPNEPVILTGCGAELLSLKLELDPAFIKIDPSSNRGSSRELLVISKIMALNGINDINSGPVYLRKSDAELK